MNVLVVRPGQRTEVFSGCVQGVNLRLVLRVCLPEDFERIHSNNDLPTLLEPMQNTTVSNH